jgi:hypothetical protein
MAGLRIITSAGSNEFPLYGLPVSVGRAADSELCLDSDGVSRKHCVIEPVGVGWSVRDLGSRNGTFVNGKRIEEHPLVDGDRIRCGEAEMQFEDPVAAWTDLPRTEPVVRVAESPAPANPPKGRAKIVEDRKTPSSSHLATVVKILVACLVLAAAGVIARNKLSGRLGTDGGGEDGPLMSGVDGDSAGGGRSQNPDQKWYLIRKTGDAPEGPLTEAEIRHAFRWGELSADATVAMLGSSEWQPIGTTRLGSGYGGREPQSAAEVSLDLSPRDFMRQYLDFQRYGFLTEDTRLLQRITIETSSWPSFMRESIEAGAQLVEAMMDSELKLHDAVDRARKAGVAIESPAEYVARHSMEKSISAGWKSDAVEEWKVGGDAFFFVRRGGRWRYLGGSVTAMFIDLQTGDWRLEMELLRKAGSDAERMRLEAQYREWLRVSTIAAESIAKATDAMVPYIERGCFTDFDRMFRVRAGLGMLYASDPTGLLGARDALEAECANKK